MCYGCFSQDSESKEELGALLEESSMPLKDVLEKYSGAAVEDASDSQSSLTCSSLELFPLMRHVRTYFEMGVCSAVSGDCSGAL